jgi:hypothetical protein
MQLPRLFRICVLLVLSLRLLQSTPSPATAQQAEEIGGWTPVDSPVVPNTLRSLGRGATLTNGQVLFVVFGSDGPLVERFDPAMNEWLTTAAPPYNPYPLSYTTHLVALADGGALLLTGDQFNQPLPTLRYNPVTNSWTRAASPMRAHTGSFGASDVTATLLADGRVLAMVLSYRTPRPMLSPLGQRSTTRQPTAGR